MREAATNFSRDAWYLAGECFARFSLLPLWEKVSPKATDEGCSRERQRITPLKHPSSVSALRADPPSPTGGEGIGRLPLPQPRSPRRSPATPLASPGARGLTVPGNGITSEMA
ncbi:hypothetical protein EN808_33475 [Mesorhizobium sp. M8A.F.Ca.ET.165.01.1.1]|nr:hypothetical protein EN808_33475 [Mesorhizobium sp. M8A.F.Ca.ET.165.01.1.1]